MAKSDDDIVSETIAPINILLMEKLNVLESHKQVAIRAYRLAESDSEAKYRKLVEGLRDLPKGEIRSNGKGGQLLMPPEYVVSYSAIESLIAEIEGGNNDKAEG